MSLQNIKLVMRRFHFFASILLIYLLVGCQTVSALQSLKWEGAFLPTEQMLAQVNERYPDMQLLEVKLKRGKSSPFYRNYHYEIKLAAQMGRSLRALKVDAHDRRILSDEPFNCSLLKRCSWK